MVMKKILFILSTALLTLTACHDDASLYGDGANTVGGNELRVVVPTSRANGYLTEAEEKAIFFTTEEECRINTLRIIVFDEDDTKVFNEAVTNIPSASYLNNHKDGNDNTYQSIETENKVKPGKYKVYVVANYNDHDATKGTYTEKKELAEVTKIQDLEKLLLEYSATAMPTAGNLPMVYVPKDENGNDKLVTVTATEGGTVYADLQFTCAKVRYNLIFDKESTDSKAKETFGDNHLGITSVDGKQLSAVAPLIWDMSFERDYTSDLYKDKTPFTAEDFSTGEYYSSWNLDENKANVTNELMVTNEEGEPTPVTNANKWLYQGTCYVPERFVTSDANQSYLQFNGQIYDSNGTATTTNHYTMPLGHNDSKSDSHKYLPRSTFYELVGNIETIGSAKLKTTVNFAPWQNVVVPADLSHTTLWVSKTIANVTSEKNDYIDYTSNANTVTMGCVKTYTVDGKEEPLIVKSTITDGRVTFQINPAIPLSKFKAGGGTEENTGTTQIYLQANNLRKYIDVTYDVSSYFKVTPTEIVITWNSADATERTRNVTFETNLGGVTVSGSTLNNGISTVGESKITVSPLSSTASSGTIAITATTDPTVTTDHYITVTAQDNKTKTEPVHIIVKPELGPYRIYMRAINDRNPNTVQNATNNPGTNDNFMGILTEEATGAGNGNSSYKSYNWNDGWQHGDTNKKEDIGNDAKTAKTANADFHYIYVYAQQGETGGTGTIPEGAVWHFSEKWTEDVGGEAMTPDYYHLGWYYWDLAFDKTVKNSGTDTSVPISEKKPKPGETLIIFNNNFYPEASTQSHRFTHYYEAGIPLFNYEDREGWYVYDPTRDPYYDVYDDRPEIEDKTYTVYTKFPIYGWYHFYGVCDRTGKNQYEIYDRTSESFTAATSKDSKGYYKTTIRLKAVKGNYSKAIMLKGQKSDNETNSESTSVMLFGGHNWTTGYFDADNVGSISNGKWYQGEP